MWYKLTVFMNQRIIKFWMFPYCGLWRIFLVCPENYTTHLMCYDILGGRVPVPADTMYLLNEWEVWTGKYLARDPEVWTKRNELCESWTRTKHFQVRPSHSFNNHFIMWLLTKVWKIRKTLFNLNRTRLTGTRKETIIKILQPAKTFP